jgi:hypothetical protein
LLHGRQVIIRFGHFSPPKVAVGKAFHI